MTLLTEDQAKTKICPLSFALPEVRDASGCGITQGGPTTCYTSGCMAWRVVPNRDVLTIEAYAMADRKIDAIKLYRQVYGVGLKEAKDHVFEIIAGTRTLPRDQMGYCGAFGEVKS